MNQQAMKRRTKEFSLRVIHLCQELPNDYVSRRIGDQLLRSGTSIGANYRAACRARSPKEFIAKLGIVEEEADEAMFWMETLIESNIVPEQLIKPLLKEANEILSIIVATIRTARSNLKK